MLRIRRAQIAALGQAATRELVDTLASTIAANYPALRAQLGAAGLAAWLTAVVERALAHGIARPRDLARYVQVACALGEDFDRDARYPWAERILATAEMTPTGKVDRLVVWARRTLAAAADAPPGDGS